MNSVLQRLWPRVQVPQSNSGRQHHLVAGRSALGVDLKPGCGAGSPIRERQGQASDKVLPAKAGYKPKNGQEAGEYALKI